MPASKASPAIRLEPGTEEARLVLAGRLDADSTGRLWPEAERLLDEARGERTVVDASAVEYCDGAGVGLLIDLLRRGRRRGGEVRLEGLAPGFERLLRLYDPAAFEEEPRAERKAEGAITQAGRATLHLVRDARRFIVFLGAMVGALGWAARHPRQVRWRDVMRVAEKAGVDALPIVALIHFLIGRILAFQSAIPMRQFGAEVFVANLVALSIVRELGPLMTAIVLTGRSGSSFAAEIGTMKVNEEIDALTTMGVDPVRFLVVPRVIAGVVTTPLLTMFANLLGLVGGAVVFGTLGFPLVTYVNQVHGAVDLGDLLGGLFKSLVFGVVVAGVGCLRGLQALQGPSAVGESTTSAVVTGILLVIVGDGIFSALFYAVGI